MIIKYDGTNVAAALIVSVLNISMYASLVWALVSLLHTWLGVPQLPWLNALAIYLVSTPLVSLVGYLLSLNKTSADD